MATMTMMTTMMTMDDSGGNKTPLIVDCVILYTAPSGDDGDNGDNGDRNDGGGESGGRQRQQQRQRQLLEEPIKEHVRAFVAAFDADDPRVVRL